MVRTLVFAFLFTSTAAFAQQGGLTPRLPPSPAVPVSVPMNVPPHLEAARAVVTLPVLRKDFTIDRVQVFEAAAFGYRD